MVTRPGRSYPGSMLERPRIAPWLFAALALAGCRPEVPEGTGGTDVTPGPFGRGVFTLNTNESYDATSASLVGVDGRVLSSTFVASGLSGDVMPPTMPSLGKDVVLIDRSYSILTWVDVRSAGVRAQLHVDGDELGRNPWDYLPVAADKALVLRYDPWPGNAEHGDVVVVNPETADVLTQVEKRIDVAAALGLPAGYVVHPARGVVAGDRAYLITVNATPEYEYTESHLVVIDAQTDEILDAMVLPGLHDCTAVALSLDREDLAIACSGDLQANGELSQEHAGVVIVSRATLAEKQRFSAAQLGGGVPGFSLSYVTGDSLLVLMVGNGQANVPDTATLVSLGTGETRDIHSAAPVQIGHVLCPRRIDGEGGPGDAPPACFVTDAEKGTLHIFPVEGDDLGQGRGIEVDDVVGLPPRYLGQF